MKHGRNSFRKHFAVADRLLIRCEKVALLLLLASMILLSFSQVIMRNFFSSGFIWVNDVLRTEVIWLAFIGAALATENKQHIRIDILSRLVRKKSAFIIINLLSDLFTACVSALMCVAAVKYIAMMKPYSQATVLFGMQEWVLRLVIPYSFAAMTIRCGVFVAKSLPVRKKAFESQPGSSENR